MSTEGFHTGKQTCPFSKLNVAQREPFHSQFCALLLLGTCFVETQPRGYTLSRMHFLWKSVVHSCNVLDLDEKNTVSHSQLVFTVNHGETPWESRMLASDSCIFIDG